jgi:hypothetical protein
MPLRQYLLRAYCWIAISLLLVGILGGSSLSAQEFGKLLVGSLIVPLFTLIFVSVLAQLTPTASRKTFWSYKWSNFVFLYPSVIAVSIVALARVANSIGN